MNSGHGSASPQETLVPIPLQQPEVDTPGYFLDKSIFNCNLPSGLEAIIEIPMVENSARPLFCISQRPVRYNAYAHASAMFSETSTSVGDSNGSTMLHTLTHPLFFTDLGSKPFVKLIDKGVVHPNDFAAASYTSITGGVGLTLHISSTTDTRGKLRIVPYTNLTRWLDMSDFDENMPNHGPYLKDTPFTKTPDIFRMTSWHFQQPFTKSTGAMVGMQTIDVSLNRTAEIPTVNIPYFGDQQTHFPNHHLPYNTHHYWRTLASYNAYPNVRPGSVTTGIAQLDGFRNTALTLFPDTGVGIFLEGDLSSTTPGTININIDFDYSGVVYNNFFMPVLPSVSSPGSTPPWMDLTRAYSTPGVAPEYDTVYIDPLA